VASGNVIPSSLIIFTPKMEVILSFETLLLTRAAQRQIPEDNIPHSHRRESLKSKQW
jgi:hypothetical protein